MSAGVRELDVLIVEDNEDQRDLLRTYLEREGCRVRPTESAEQAMDAIGAGLRPQFAIVDLMLPGMTGWELVERLASLVPACSVAATSVLDAHHFPDNVMRLPKPFTRAHVVGALAACTERRPAS
jgi:CheY-like chemotaxis protein